MIPDPNLRLANPVRLERASRLLDVARLSLANELLRRHAANPEELREEGATGLKRPRRRCIPSTGEAGQ